MNMDSYTDPQKAVIGAAEAQAIRRRARGKGPPRRPKRPSKSSFGQFNFKFKKPRLKTVVRKGGDWGNAGSSWAISTIADIGGQFFDAIFDAISSSPFSRK